MKVLITGSSGLIGSALVEALATGGHEVGRLLRKPGDGNTPWWDPLEGKIDLCEFDAPEVVIHLAGDNLATGRWTAAKKSRILNSRLRGTKMLADFFSQCDPKPRLFLSGSAVGFYGDCGQTIVDESSPPGRGFLADVCKQWEDATIPAANVGIRVVTIRTGMVLSPAGGALKKMLPPFKLGLGGVLGGGRQYMSWISIDDVVGSVQWLMANDSIRGPVNLVSPTPVTNAQFTKALGAVLRRPTIFPMPAFAARAIFGEMADELLLSSVRVAPTKLNDSGYTFRDPELSEALRRLLKTGTAARL